MAATITITDDDIQLSDMLESYPSSMTPGFQTLLTAKKEFNELAASPTDRLPPGRGKFFPHQRFTHRFLRTNDRLAIFSETGTGKSCEVLGFIEYTRKEFDKAKINPYNADERVAHYKQAIILVRGRTQKNEFRNQLVCRCSDGRFETAMVRRTDKETVQKTNIALEIKRAGYRVVTYESFSNRINEQVARAETPEAGWEEVAREYSDTTFWGDEVHNLLFDPGNVTAYRKKQEIYHTLWKLWHIIQRSQVIVSTATPMLNTENEMGPLMNLVLPLNGQLPVGYDYRNAPPNDIRVLFPNLPFDHRIATPEQISPYFRGQMPSDYDFSTATLLDLEPFFRGKITYIRASDTGAIPQDVGATQLDELVFPSGVTYRSQLVLYTTEMSEFQNASYLEAQRANSGRDDLFGAERQAANFVFPDGYWGNGITEEERTRNRAQRRARAIARATAEATAEGIINENTRTPQDMTGTVLPVNALLTAIGETADEDEEGNVREGQESRAFRRFVSVHGDTFAPTAEFAPWLRELKFIRTLSSKYATIVEKVMNDPGNAFVYGEFVVGSGVIVLALCLEGMGFVRYNESASMFIGAGAGILKPVCAGNDANVNVRRVRPDILSHSQGAPLRYAMLTRDTSPAKFQSMMEAMNSYENRHSEYIKVLIASPVGRDAINVNNVLQIHLIGAEWNPSALYQAVSRGIRATSHEDLLNEERARITAEGGDPELARIIVAIYRHAAVTRQEVVNPTTTDRSIDIKMYQVSEYKDRGIRRIMRIVKQTAIGCQVHYLRNVREGDVDGTAACDYQQCDYQCVDPTPIGGIDYSTYDVLYAGELIAETEAEIINIYRQRNALTLPELQVLLPEYRRKYLIMALEQLITNKIAMTDRFGYTVYLREDNGTFYLDRSYPTGTNPSYAMAYYTQGIIAIEQKTLANIVTGLEVGGYKQIAQELEQLGPNHPDFVNNIDGLPVEGRVAIVEDVIVRAANGNRNAFTDAVINKFHRWIFDINDPTTELNKVYERLNQRRPKRGRRANPDTKKRRPKLNANDINNVNMDLDTDTEMVYLHTLYSLLGNQTAYATTARVNKGEGRTRIFKPSEAEEGWRDVNPIELEVYNTIIQLENARRVQPFAQMGVYGYMEEYTGKGKNAGTNVFKISNRLLEDEKAKTDARRERRGRICITWERPDLIDVMWHIQAPPPTGTFVTPTEENRQQLVNHLMVQRNVTKTYNEFMAWPLDRLLYYYKWSFTNYDRVWICDYIHNHMIQTGRMQNVV